MIKPENQCLGKQKYDTSKEGHKQVAHMNSRGKNKMVAYKCSDCKAWHFGHAGRGNKIKNK